MSKRKTTYIDWGDGHMVEVTNPDYSHMPEGSLFCPGDGDRPEYFCPDKPELHAIDPTKKQQRK